ncbi:related to polyketide synthase modules and related proteins [Armillaria ostoyae]|uniref:Related to polyketide synthase modules and related proteins n=1 Tax=Armillaria ostoyae TaxID=47428 RepID=A0A284QW92_ARMOS|nr:related to polyketide synthase modules and related proteins [Armillaria ostoyae]
MTSTTFCIDVPVFGGQGTAAANSPQARQQALLDASSPSGSVLLAACHATLHAELETLSSTELSQANIDLSDFQTKESILALPTDRYLHNAVISGTTLFLLQTLRYLAYIDASVASNGSLTPFSDVLKLNSVHGVGILGFSSGILPAAIVATSFSSVSFLARAVEAYRLAIWIGVRAQIFRGTMLSGSFPEAVHSSPWSLVFLGLNKEDAEVAISDFAKTIAEPSLYVTATMDANSVTISGRPDTLSAFSEHVTACSSEVSIVVHKTTLNALYHAPLHVAGAREEILNDIIRRGIQFPKIADIHVPFRSTFTGEALKKDMTGSLVELVVDMVISQPVNWDLVTSGVLKDLPNDASVRLLNVGPGSGLCRGLERALCKRRVKVLDLTTLDAKSARPSKGKQEAIAIVGMAVNMPGAPNVSKLWEVLEQGINTISEVPENRFKVSDYNEAKNPKRQMKAHTGNFIGGADEFDNRFFKISPREAKSMDPQQRVLLHTTYEALEDAGYVPNATPSFNPDTFGCYIGAVSSDYSLNLRDDIDVYYSTGTLKAFLCGRLSYSMQLSGPSIVVDTACSSSGVAVYQGARALMNRDCNAAIVGGVNVISSPDMFLGLDRSHFLSPTGQCKAFDASADGYSRSEGCGIFVLKRLSDAIVEDDKIWGVIRGVEVNQSGLAHSITHPHAPTQITLFKQLLENTGVDASRINVVEAHGTGTQAGDPNELESIRGVFAQKRSAKNPLHITSVKANIGHLESASGAAGLAKILLMMAHRTIPRLISLHDLNPRIASLDADNTIIDRVHAAWEPSPGGQTRMALLNNFGAAGSNTATLVEEFARPSPVQLEAIPVVFGLSAKTDTALEKLRAKYISWLQSSESADERLVDIAYTSTSRRQFYEHRTAVAASTREELIEKLQKAKFVQSPSQDGKAVFVFSGQGAQYLEMGRTLYDSSPIFKSHIDECHSFLIASGFYGVLAIIAPGPDDTGLTETEEFEAYQAAIFALEYALAKLWMSWGVKPIAVVGHSLGEYAALVIANVLSLRGALTIIAHRVRLMVTKCAVSSTSMIAVNLAQSLLQDILKATTFDKLSISCFNSPVDCVVSGPLEQLRALKEHLDAEVHCKNVPLTVPFGYHSIAMAPILDDLDAVALNVTLRAPTIPIISNVHGDVVHPGDASVFDAQYFSRHCAEPVQFDRGIHALIALPECSKIDAWLEIGPHTTCLPMIKAITAPHGAPLLLGSIRKQRDPWSTLTATLAQLYQANVPVSWRETFSHVPDVSCISLPSYPFAQSKFWVTFKEEIAVEKVSQVEIPAKQTVSNSALLHEWIQEPSSANAFTSIFETPISMLAGSITGHRVGGIALCPASVYLEQLYAGIDLTRSHLGSQSSDKHAILRAIKLTHGLVYDESVARIVVTVITLTRDSGAFNVSSRVEGSNEQISHAHGEFRLQPAATTLTEFSCAFPTISRHIAAVTKPGLQQETLSTWMVYDGLFPRVVDYSKEYHTMQSLTIDASHMEGCAQVRLPRDHDKGPYVVHPVFMDTVLHVAGFVANMQGERNDAFVCTQVGSVKIIPEFVDTNAEYVVYCSNVWAENERTILAEAWVYQKGEPSRVVACMKGIQFRRLKLDAFSRLLARAVRKPPQSSLNPAAPSTARRPTVHHQRSSEPEAPNVESTVLTIVAETCDVSPSSVSTTTDLEAIGVDSEIFARLQQSFAEYNLSAHSLTSCRTTGDIIREVTANRPTNATSIPSSPTLRATTSAPSSPATLFSDDQLPEPNQLSVDDEPDIKSVLATVLDIGVDDIQDDTDFEHLGLDSLTSIEALHSLKSELGLDLPNDFFTTCNTVHSVQDHLRRHRQAAKKAVAHISASKNLEGDNASTSHLVKSLRLESLPSTIQTHPGNDALPLFLIHDGSGLVNNYSRLPPLARSIYGIHNPHFISSQPWKNVVEMSQAYAKVISQVSKGPLLLGGWSFGGVAAYETALQLQKQGITVKGILLIDSPNPINHVPLSKSLIATAVRLDSRSSGSTEVGQLVKKQFAMNAAMLKDYDPRATHGVCPPMVLLRSSEGFNPEGVADVPKWLADRSDAKNATTGWDSLTPSPVKVFDIPGNHFQPFSTANIASVSSKMADACRYLEGV